MPTTETMLKTREVAYRLGLSNAQVGRYVKKGDLHAQRVGKELLFRESDVSEFARARGIHPPTEAERGVPQGENFPLDRAIRELVDRGYLVTRGQISLVTA